MEPNRKLHSLENKAPASSMSTKSLLLLIGLMIVLGVGSGFLLSRFPSSSNTTTTTKKDQNADTSGKTSAGVLDKKTFTDSAQGTLKEGGFEGEGNFHLVRPGGDSQNVYLTSTAVDLSTFIGKKVTVWGKTYDSEKAGWLMDVGYIEVTK